MTQPISTIDTGSKLPLNEPCCHALYCKQCNAETLRLRRQGEAVSKALRALVATALKCEIVMDENARKFLDVLDSAVILVGRPGRERDE